jgi:hypothetical protein
MRQRGVSVEQPRGGDDRPRTAVSRADQALDRSGLPVCGFLPLAIRKILDSPALAKLIPYLPLRIGKGEIDPSLAISHGVSIDPAPAMYYKAFRDKQDRCTKVLPDQGGHSLPHSAWQLSTKTCGRSKPRIKLFRQTYFPFANPIEWLVSDRSGTQIVHRRDLVPQTLDFGPGT